MRDMERRGYEVGEGTATTGRELIGARAEWQQTTQRREDVSGCCQREAEGLSKNKLSLARGPKWMFYGSQSDGLQGMLTDLY